MLLKVVTSLKSFGRRVQREALPCLESCLGPPSSSLWTTENRLEHLEAGISEADTYPRPHRKCLTLELQVVDPDPEKARWGPPTPGRGQSATLAMLALAPWWNQVCQGGCIYAKILSLPQKSKRKFQQRNTDSSPLPPEEHSTVETHVMSHVSRWLSHHSQSRVIRLESQLLWSCSLGFSPRVTSSMPFHDWPDFWHQMLLAPGSVNTLETQELKSSQPPIAAGIITWHETCVSYPVAPGSWRCEKQACFLVVSKYFHGDYKIYRCWNRRNIFPKIPFRESRIFIWKKCLNMPAKWRVILQGHI